MNKVEEVMKKAQVSYPVVAEDVKASSTVKSMPEEEKVVRTPEMIIEAQKETLKDYTSDKFLEKVGAEIGPVVDSVMTNVELFKARLGAADPIDALSFVSKINKDIKNITEDIIPFCNSQWLSGNASSGIASFKKFTPKRVWEYSEELTAAIDVIAVRKKVEEGSGDAKDITKDVNVLSSKLFAISLNK